MAKVILHPIGSSVKEAVDEKSYRDNFTRMEELNRVVLQRREEVRQGWGKVYIERVHAKGKLTSWERIELLKDSESTVFPINTFVNYGLEFGQPPRTSPAAGVITAFVRVHGRLTVVIANDNTVASGSWWPLTPEKIERAQEVGLRLKVPVIYLVDCSGLNLPEQSKTFPGRTGAGYIFKMNSLLSAAGVPQIAGVLGDCIAGGGYMPIISDKLFMTEQAYMVIAGAALIKGAKSQKITSLTIGGPDVHVHLSNCADERVPDDQTMIRRIRQEIKKLPTSAVQYYRHQFSPAQPRFATQEINGLLPVDHRVVYDVRQIIARLVDSSLFWELMPHTGEEMVTGVARISGLHVGIIANNQQLTPHPELKDRTRAGGLLYREGIAKISQFSRACDSDGIPIIWLQDVSGFDIGVEAEKHGLLGFGSNLLYTNSTNTVPMMTVLLRKASGAGYYAMTGLPYEPIVQISTPLTRLAVMEGRTLSIGAFGTKLDDNFQIVTENSAERDKIEKGMKAVEGRIEADMDPYKAACQMDTDEIVPVGELRNYLMTLVEMCYQSIGHRRIKNPRIWSMHDLSVLTDSSS